MFWVKNKNPSVKFFTLPQKCIIYSNIKATAHNIKIIHKNIIEKIEKMGVLGHPQKAILYITKT